MPAHVIILGRFGSHSPGLGGASGWNLIFIDSSYAWVDTSRKLSEPEIFNAIIGYPPVVTTLVLLMALSFLFFRIPNNNKHAIDF